MKSTISPNRWQGEAECVVGPFKDHEVAEAFAGLTVDFGQHEAHAKQVVAGEAAWYVEVRPYDVKETPELELKRAFERMGKLLCRYGEVADAVSYFYAEALVAQLRADAAGFFAKDEVEDLLKHVMRQTYALARDVDEWQGDDFYALRHRDAAFREERR
jgi:hypothetical protein